MKQLLKVFLSFLLPLAAGIIVVFLFATTTHEAKNLQLFFTLWLVSIPLCAGFVSGWQYPLHPYQAGFKAGLVLVLLLIAALFIFVPLLRVPWFLISLAAITVAITLGAALLAVIALKAKAILQQEKEQERQKEEMLMVDAATPTAEETL